VDYFRIESGRPSYFQAPNRLDKGQLTAHIIPPDSRPQASPATTYGAYGAHIPPDHLSLWIRQIYGLPTFSTDVPPRAALPVAPMDARKDERIQLG
jgi:hypothetical protein